MTPSIPASKRRLTHLMGNYAGFATRAIAFVIDVLLLSITVVIVAGFFSTTVKMMQLRALATNFETVSPVVTTVVDFIFSPGFYSIVSVSFVIFYYLFLWTVAGQTIGKAVMGIRIVSQDGRKLKLTQAIIRYIGYYISAIALGLGFFWVLFDDHRLAWHDKLAKTCVLYAWDAHPDETFLVQATERLVSQRRTIQYAARKLRQVEMDNMTIPALPDAVSEVDAKTDSAKQKQV
jgi:uncharacterized RDD family membrane protein YckC